MFENMKTLMLKTKNTVRVVAVGSEPACGKTSIFRELIRRTGGSMEWWPVREKLLTYHSSSTNKALILGDYTPQAGAFAGTDKLSMAVQATALDKITKLGGEYRTVLFEGDRLYNKSFFQSLKDANVPTTIIELTADAATLDARHKARGDTQTAKWLQGRKTKLLNVRKVFTVELRPNATKMDLEKNVEYLIELLGVK